MLPTSTSSSTQPSYLSQNFTSPSLPTTLTPIPLTVTTSEGGGTWTHHEEGRGQGKESTGMIGVTRTEGTEGRGEKTSRPLGEKEGEEVSMAKRQRQ